MCPNLGSAAYHIVLSVPLSVSFPFLKMVIMTHLLHRVVSVKHFKVGV